MNVYRTIAAEMPKAADAITAPALRPGKPIIRAHGVRASTSSPLNEGAGQGDTHIEPWMLAAFRGLTSSGEDDSPFALMSCFMNGEPAAIIAFLHDEGRRTQVVPLFMAVQPHMKFAPHDDDEPDG